MAISIKIPIGSLILRLNPIIFNIPNAINININFTVILAFLVIDVIKLLIHLKILYVIVFLNNVLDLILFIIVSKKNTKEIYPITAPIAVPESISVKFSEVRAIKNPQPIINKINNIISATRSGVLSNAFNITSPFSFLKPIKKQFIISNTSTAIILNGNKYNAGLYNI